MDYDKMTNKDLRQVARDSWEVPMMTPSLEHLRVGAILRVADALSRIAMALEEKTPKSVEEHNRRKASEDRRDEVAAWLVENGVENPTDLWRWPLAFVDYETARRKEVDYTSKESWMLVAKHGRKFVRNFGEATADRLVGWCGKKWPESA